MSIPLRAADQYRNWAPDRAELLAAVRADLSAQQVPRVEQEKLLEAIAKEQVTPEGLAVWLDGFAARSSWGDAWRAAAFNTAGRIAQNGEAAVLAGHKGSLPDAGEVIRETEELMRLDYPAYLKNSEVQAQYYEALERQHSQAPVPVAAAPRNDARVKEIEGLMGDQTSIYHRGEQSAALQQEYRDLVTPPPAAPPAPASTGEQNGQ
jgi:hypothetical protein